MSPVSHQHLTLSALVETLWVKHRGATQKKATFIFYLCIVYFERELFATWGQNFLSGSQDKSKDSQHK